MSVVDTLLATGASLLFLAVLFIPMEKTFPANPGQKVFRAQWLLDLCYFLGQYLLWSSLVLKLLYYLSVWLEENFALSFNNFFSDEPLWLQAIIVLVLSDFLIYWGHRFQHKYDFLWRFHKVHHTTEKLDWLAAHREHPIDSVYTVGIINLPAMLLGFDLEVLAMIVAFRGLWAIYIHSNVRLNIGSLKMLIGSPDLHHWHHDKERDRGNYANISPLMDLLFGTYVCPDHEPEQFGIKEEFPRSYVGQLLKPMLPDRMWQAIKKRVSKPNLL